jgi:Tfp pilus assembly protein PilV
MHLRSLLKRLQTEQSGVTIIEVLVSGVVLVIASAGLYTALSAGNRATAQERHRVKANDLAEQELERVRSLRIGDLSSWSSTRAVLEDGTELPAGSTCSSATQTCYTVTSSTQFLQEPAATSTCAAGTGSRDFLSLQVSVTWTGIGPLHPVTANTIISPPSGSLVPNSGSLLVLIADADNDPIPDVTVTGSGAGTFTGSTGSTGCVLWHNLPAGNYSMSLSGAVSGMVDPDGDAPPGISPTPAQTVSVVDQGTNTISLQFDRPGGLTAAFKTLNYSGTLINSSADGISVKAPGMTTWKTFSSANSPSITTSQTLFPFASPTTYAAYAGRCAQNNPDPTGSGANPLSFANVTVPAAGTGTTPDNAIQLPSLRLTVQTGSSSSIPGAVVTGADVHVKDVNCSVTRTLTTNSSGQLADTATGPTDPGLPYGTAYTVCADANVSGTQRMNFARVFSSVDQFGLTDPTVGVAKTIYLTGTGATSGSGAQCP